MRPRPGIFAVTTPAAPPGARIGLLGGSFNPAHDGHRQISEIARRRLGLAAVWWLVSPGNPLKSKGELAALGDRIAIARQVAAAPWIEVTGFEAALGSAYTVDTLQFLARRHPNTEFVWLMGADNLATLHRWRSWRQIAATFPMAVVDRPGWHLAALASPAARALARDRLPEAEARRLPELTPPAWVFLTGPLSSRSSSAIRAARRAGAERGGRSQP